MPRKKKAANVAANTETVTETGATTAPSTAVAEPPAPDYAPREAPAWIDGPQFVADVPTDGPANPAAKNWGPPYKAIFTSTEKGFEMGENRRYKQRVFLFREKPAEDVIATLKENGFTYRPAEKAWTITANPDTRKLSEDLAGEFAGEKVGMSR